MSIEVSRLVRRLTASGAVLALVSGCMPNPEAGRIAAAPKTPANRNLTSFTDALRCMDDLFLAYGKRDVVVTTAGIPDSTGKVQAGTKEMLISAVSKMSVKSKAITLIDYDTEKSDLLVLFQDVSAALGPNMNRKLPSYYIRGAITQLDENAMDTQVGGSIATPYFDLGLTKDQVVSLVSVDMNVGETVSRMILPGVGASNSMAVVRAGTSGEAGGKISKAGLNLNVSLNRSEGLGAATRALIELGAIETMGKLANVPYWKCLGIDKTNSTMMSQARDWWDAMDQRSQISFVQRKLAAIGAYGGAATGVPDATFQEAVQRYQGQNDLIANGRVDFDLYYRLLDNQNEMKGEPQKAAMTTPVSTGPRQASGRLEVTLNTDRGQRPVYAVNEYLDANAQLSGDGLLYCYYRGADGNIARIFPNRFQPQPLVQGGRTVAIPGSSKFRIKFDQSGVKEHIACFATQQDVALPASLKGNDLVPLKVGSLEEIEQAFKTANPLVAQGKLDISVK